MYGDMLIIRNHRNSGYRSHIYRIRQTYPWTSKGYFAFCLETYRAPPGKGGLTFVSIETAIEKYVRQSTPGIRDDGMHKVLKGITTLEEVLRVTREDG